jgi:hypothetical protein
LESSLATVRDDSTGRKCSTPFGIIGIFTPPRSPRPRPSVGAQRLSASLESSPSTKLQPRRASHCAQRLSASLESSQTSSRRPRAKSPRAQRLSASLESSPRSRASPIGARTAVLNAFRHHWNLHGAYDKGSRWRTSCAQRLSASLESSLRG